MVENQDLHGDGNEEIWSLSGTELGVMEDTCDWWIIAYKQDPKLRTALWELHLGKPYGQMQLNSLGLLVLVMNNGERKLVVPQSLRREVLKECRGIPTVGHLGMQSTLELIDCQFT